MRSSNIARNYFNPILFQLIQHYRFMLYRNYKRLGPLATYSLLIVLFFLLPIAGQAKNPILTDNRIKTYVYNDSEVFKVTVHYGYHSYIEFSEGESPSYIQFGDGFPWGYDVIDNKLFLKAIDSFSHTNMTVITNKDRTYQFDIRSKLPPASIDSNLTYIIRFYYPMDDLDSIKKVANDAISQDIILPKNHDYNFDYSIVGSDRIAPSAVFDDGTRTYFKFDNMSKNIPAIALLDGNGIEIPLDFTQENNFYVVSRVANQYTLRHGRELVCLFNERSYR